jgi:CMP-N-acetylneuraminic acid synthetase
MIAILPIRSGSKGIPNKNIKLFNGKPLVWWVLKSLEKSIVEKIIVATDKEYIDILNNFNFKKIVIYERKKINSLDSSSTEDVLLEVIDKFSINESIILVQATSPLTTSENINEAINVSKNYDSLLSVVRQDRFLWNVEGKPMNYDYNKRPRRQQFKGHFVENGAIYINHSHNIKKFKNRLSGKIGLYIMDDSTYFEIDEEKDWELISILQNLTLDEKK